MMPTVKNASEFYRADLSHVVNVLGAALRSLDRMQKWDEFDDVDHILWKLQEELKWHKEKEKNERERS